MAHDGEVVGDEQVRQSVALAQIGEQVDDLSLDRDVEARDGFDDAPRSPSERGRQKSFTFDRQSTDIGQNGGPFDGVLVDPI